MNRTPRSLLIWRILLAPVVLAILLSPARVLYACKLMDGPAQMVCCCHHDTGGCVMGRGCESHGFNARIACCDVSIDGPVYTVAAPGSLVQMALGIPQEPPRPPPGAVPTTLGIVTAAARTDYSSPRFLPFVPTAGTQTYLLTNRFRT